jgi:very-short-patch-repair endonuclease
LDSRIAVLAEGQHGVVGRAQLEDLGLEPGAIGRRIRAGRLHRLHEGVYAVGHRSLTQRSRWMAAVLACGPNAVLSHWSAAALWGIRGNRSGPIDITSPSKTKSRGAIRRHRMLLPRDEVTVEHGIPVTTAPRMVFDLAAVSDAHVVESALRQCEYLRLYDPLSLGDLVDRYPGQRGNRNARAALARLEESSGETEAGLEERFLSFLDAHRLPRPDFNAWLEAQGQRYKVDCLWPDQRLIAELDSWQAHGTRSSFQSDKTRDRRLLRAGYRTTRITWAQLDDEPEQVAADLRALLLDQYKRP